MSSLGFSTFQLAYEISPIILQGGLAQSIPGQLLPITVLTEMFDIPGIENGEFFAHYKPLPGSTLADFQVAEYPFASLQVAANAVIQQPLKISLLMVCPAQTEGGYILKQAIMTALQTQINTHIIYGGTFTVITPAYTYTNCLLTNLRDVSSPSDKQVQLMYQWDFVQPLISESQFSSVLGGVMNSITQGLPTFTTLGASWSGQ